MKLRIKGNSLWVRVSRSEVTGLLADGCLEERIYFAPEKGALRQEASFGRPAVLIERDFAASNPPEALLQ
jgi:uncharacterized protein DUF7009